MNYKQQDQVDESENHEKIVEILNKKYKSEDALEILKKKFENVDHLNKTKKQIDDESFYKLLKNLQYEKHSANQILFRNGEPAYKYYIIIKGSVSVRVHNKPEDLVPISINDKKKLKMIFNENGVLSSENDLNKEEFESQKSVINISNRSKKISHNDFHFDFNGLRIPHSATGNIVEWDTRTNLKQNRPFVKFAYYISQFWSTSQKTSQQFKSDTDLPQNTFQKYDVKFYENQIFKKYSKFVTISPNLVSLMMPSTKKVLQYKHGQGFGELALLKKCTRTTTIICDTDCEFATLTRKNQALCNVLNYQSKAIQIFLKSFDVFQWWVNRERLSEVTSLFTKVTTKAIGDYIYKKGQKSDCIYFLKQGEIQLTLNQSERCYFEITDKEITKNEKTGKQLGFKRNLIPPCIFGVEEILAGCPNRLFSAQCKTAANEGVSCVYFEISKEKLFMDLQGRDSDFQSKLQKYSCFTNESLRFGYDMNHLHFLKKRSFETVKCDSTSLMTILSHQDRFKKAVAKNWKEAYKKNENITKENINVKEHDEDLQDTKQQDPSQTLKDYTTSEADIMLKSIQNPNQYRFVETEVEFMSSYNHETKISKIVGKDTKNLESVLKKKIHNINKNHNDFVTDLKQNSLPKGSLLDFRIKLERLKKKILMSQKNTKSNEICRQRMGQMMESPNGEKLKKTRDYNQGLRKINSYGGIAGKAITARNSENTFFNNVNLNMYSNDNLYRRRKPVNADFIEGKFKTNCNKSNEKQYFDSKDLASDKISKDNLRSTNLALFSSAEKHRSKNSLASSDDINLFKRNFLNDSLNIIDKNEEDTMQSTKVENSKLNKHYNSDFTNKRSKIFNIADTYHKDLEIQMQTLCKFKLDHYFKQDLGTNIDKQKNTLKFNVKLKKYDEDKFFDTDTTSKGPNISIYKENSVKSEIETNNYGSPIGVGFRPKHPKLQKSKSLASLKKRNNFTTSFDYNKNIDQYSTNFDAYKTSRSNLNDRFYSIDKNNTFYNKVIIKDRNTVNKFSNFDRPKKSQELLQMCLTNCNSQLFQYY